MKKQCDKMKVEKLEEMSRVKWVKFRFLACLIALFLPTAQAQNFYYQNDLSTQSIINSDFTSVGNLLFQVLNNSLQFVVSSNPNTDSGGLEFRQNLNLAFDFQVILDVSINSSKDYGLNPNPAPEGFLLAGLSFSPNSLQTTAGNYTNLISLNLKRGQYENGIFNFVSQPTKVSGSETFNRGPLNQISDISLKAEYSAATKVISFFWKSKNDLSFIYLSSRDLLSTYNLNGNENLYLLIGGAAKNVLMLQDDIKIKNLYISTTSTNNLSNNVSLVLQKTYSLNNWLPIATNNIFETNPKAFYRLQIQKQ